MSYCCCWLFPSIPCPYLPTVFVDDKLLWGRVYYYDSCCFCMIFWLWYWFCEFWPDDYELNCCWDIFCIIVGCDWENPVVCCWLYKVLPLFDCWLLFEFWLLMSCGFCELFFIFYIIFLISGAWWLLVEVKLPEWTKVPEL